MRKKELIYFSLACIGIIASIILFIFLSMFMAIANDLSNEIIQIKQDNTELKWELDQVDQMICVNEEIK